MISDDLSTPPSFIIIAGVVCLIGSSSKSGSKTVTLSFFPIIGFFFFLGLLFSFLLFWCILSCQFLVETSECLPFATLRRVTDPSSLTFSSSFLGTPVPLVPIPHSDAGKLSLLWFLIVGQPFGMLWFCTLALLLLVQILLLLLLRGTFELSL